MAQNPQRREGSSDYHFVAEVYIRKGVGQFPKGAVGASGDPFRFSNTHLKPQRQICPKK